MIQNIGGFLTLAWLWSQRDKAKVPVEAKVPDLLDLPSDHPCARMTPGSPAWLSCVTTHGQPPTTPPPPANGNGNGNGFDLNGNGNGEEPDIIGPLPVDPDEFDITTLPEYALWDGIACAEHYTKVRVSGPYFVCKRDDLV